MQNNVSVVPIGLILKSGIVAIIHVGPVALADSNNRTTAAYFSSASVLDEKF